MKIISKFKDYYDIGMGLGFDESIVYVREPREVDLKADRRNESPEDKSTRNSAKLLDSRVYLPTYRHISPIFVGFCGKFYPALTYDKKEMFYSISELDKWIEKTESKSEYRHYMESNEYRWGCRYTAIKFFERSYDLPEVFIVNRSPIVVVYENRAIWNSSLREYSFERIVNPYDAYQEISMFIGNLATPEKPIPPMSDNAKANSHGFDKWSFRKKKDE